MLVMHLKNRNNAISSVKFQRISLYIYVTFCSICFGYSIYSIEFNNALSIKIQNDLIILNTTKNESNIFCSYWHPNNVLFGANHKTGTILFRNCLLPIVMQFWKSKCNNKNHHKGHANIMTHSHINKMGLKRFIKGHKNKLNKTYIILLNIIRSPVDTILSGYNYHKVTEEGWVSVPFKQNHKHPRNYWIFIGKTMNKVLVNKYENLTLKHIYNEYNMSIGLAIEYQRYIECEYSRIYGSYNMMEYNLKQKYKNYFGVHINVFRLEDVQTHFNETMETLLDALFIRIDADKKHLLNILQRFQINNNSHNDHVTQGTYNKQQQIYTLLSNEDRCNILKEKTILLDYKWIYHEYC
eukprot:337912_1